MSTIADADRPTLSPSQGVSPRAAKRLRDAMDRLLAGRPQRTDGRLIKDNLWKEADVSRATMNRATRILAEWNARVAACDGFTPREARKNDELTTLRDELATRPANAPSSTPTRRGRHRDRRTPPRQHPATSRTRPARPTRRPQCAPHHDNVTSHQRTGVSA